MALLSMLRPAEGAPVPLVQIVRGPCGEEQSRSASTLTATHVSRRRRLSGGTARDLQFSLEAILGGYRLMHARRSVDLEGFQLMALADSPQCC